MQNLCFILIAAATCALCACNPDVLLKLYPGGAVVVDRKIAVARGAAVYFGTDTATARNRTNVAGLEHVQMVQHPSQGEFSAIHGASIPYQIARNLRSDCTLRLPDWRVCYRAGPGAYGVDAFSFDYHSTTGCVIRYNCVV